MAKKKETKGRDITSKINKVIPDNRKVKKPEPPKKNRGRNTTPGKKLVKRTGIRGKASKAKAAPKAKQSSGSVEYPEKMVRAANERLRKLEKVSKKAESSSLYQRMKAEMFERPNKGGKFFQPGKNKGSLRFIGKRKFQQLTEEEQIAYLKRLTGFMQSDMSTASGLKKIRDKLAKANKNNEEARRKAFETFKERPEIKDKFPNLTFEQYTNMFHAYQYYTDVKGEHFNYDDLTLFLENVNLDQLDPYQIEEAMSFVKDDNWGELVDRGWLQEF